MARLLTIPVFPNPRQRKQEGPPNPRFLEGQRKLVGAMDYLAKAGRRANRDAVQLLLEHLRTQFRITDRP